MSSQTDTAAAVDAATAYLREHDAEHLAQLDDFLRIESVSADPGRNEDVRRAAQWIVDELTRLGVERATIHETSAHPIVTAEWMHAGADAPTVLVYCHYDVQPADPLDEWIRPPFEPRHEGERVYARGAGDDKGQLFMHLKAVEAWMRTVGRLPVNLRFFFEGDEEVGSEPVEQFIVDHADLLHADVCVVSDGDTFDDDGTPAIGYGLRGIAYWEVRVHGPRQDVHSGQYGGGVDNPANVLVRMLASMVDGDGRVTVPGFYDDVRDLTDDERAAYAALPFSEDGWRGETGVRAAMDGETGYTLLERLSARPTFDINGIWGGYSGAGFKTVLPGEAHAKVSFRLVSRQDPERILTAFRAWAEAQLPADCGIVWHDDIQGSPASVMEIGDPAFDAARIALTEEWGRPAAYIGSGGSIPIAGHFKTCLGMDAMLIGFGRDDDQIHSPNEKYDLDCFRKGIRSWARILAKIAG